MGVNITHPQTYKQGSNHPPTSIDIGVQPPTLLWHKHGSQHHPQPKGPNHPSIQKNEGSNQLPKYRNRGYNDPHTSMETGS